METRKVYVGASHREFVALQRRLEKEGFAVYDNCPPEGDLEGLEEVEVGGGMLGICVFSTAKAALQRGSRVTINLRNVFVGEVGGETTAEKNRTIGFWREVLALTGEEDLLNKLVIQE